MNTVSELGARCVDAAGNAHALVLLERPRVEHHHLLAARTQLVQIVSRDARRLVLVLDEFAECFRRHVDAAEELAAGGAPGIAAAVEDVHRRVAERAQARGGRCSEAFTAVEHDERCSAPRHQVGDHEL